MDTNQTEGTSYRQVVTQLEDSIRRRWRDEQTDGAFLDDASDRRHRYVLGMFPYPSGKAHLGHILVYSLADALARLGRFKGELVLNPLGWDAFGRPAENAAMKNDIHPLDWTERNIASMREGQIGRAGFSFDLSHVLTRVLSLDTVAVLETLRTRTGISGRLTSRRTEDRRAIPMGRKLTGRC